MKKTIIVVDLEGTLANSDHRYSLLNAKDFNAYEDAMKDDSLYEDTFEILAAFDKRGFDIVVLTARSVEHQIVTMRWLSEKKIPASALVMRPLKDWTPAPDFKASALKDIVESYKNDGFEAEILLVLDDSEAVCAKLREEGYNVWQKI